MASFRNSFRLTIENSRSIAAVKTKTQKNQFHVIFAPIEPIICAYWNVSHVTGYSARTHSGHPDHTRTAHSSIAQTYTHTHTKWEKKCAHCHNFYYLLLLKHLRLAIETHIQQKKSHSWHVVGIESVAITNGRERKTQLPKWKRNCRLKLNWIIATNRNA